MGTTLSLAVMLFTNFLIDAPLTKYLTNKFIKNIDKDKKQTKTLENFFEITLDTFIKNKMQTKEVQHD